MLQWYDFSYYAMQCHNSFFSKVNVGKHPILIEVPHGGSQIPSFMNEYIRDIESVENDKDWFTQEAYGALKDEVNGYIQWNVARMLADPNRK